MRGFTLKGCKAVGLIGCLERTDLPECVLAQIGRPAVGRGGGENSNLSGGCQSRKRGERRAWIGQIEPLAECREGRANRRRGGRFALVCRGCRSSIGFFVFFD